MMTISNHVPLYHLPADHRIFIKGRVKHFEQIYSEKTIKGYLDSVPSLTFNTIKTKLIMHVFHSSRYLQSKGMFDLSHASMIKVQYMSKWYNILY